MKNQRKNLDNQQSPKNKIKFILLTVSLYNLKMNSCSTALKKLIFKVKSLKVSKNPNLSTKLCFKVAKINSSELMR